MIKVRWFGHSMWKISNDEVSIVIDPFSDIGYPMPKHETGDILLCTHNHHDHNNLDLIGGTFLTVNQPGKYEYKNVEIEAIPVWHDACQGKKRGMNLLMRFYLDGRTFLHCGDLGHDLTDDLISKLGKIDILFIPVGGVYTIEAKTAKNLVDKIDPRIVFPMHYKTADIAFRLAGVDEFLKLVSNPRKIDSHTFDLLPVDFEKQQTIILNYR